MLFNCEQWGISLRSIVLTTSGSSVTINPRVASCDSLVRVCISTNVVLVLQGSWYCTFFPIHSKHWVHIAEVTFYGAGPTFPRNAIITTATTTELTTADGNTIENKLILIAPRWYLTKCNSHPSYHLESDLVYGELVPKLNGYRVIEMPTNVQCTQKKRYPNFWHCSSSISVICTKEHFM